MSVRCGNPSESVEAEVVSDNEAEGVSEGEVEVEVEEEDDDDDAAGTSEPEGVA